MLAEDVLRETQQIFREMDVPSMSTQEVCNSDYRAYEEELRKAGKKQKKSKKANGQHSRSPSSDARAKRHKSKSLTVEENRHKSADRSTR